jgi:5-methylcytosine-specific restriction endonuclease McrA
MRYSIKDQIPEIFAACEALSAAADAHLSGNGILAEETLMRANCPIVWSWLNPAWVDVDRNVVHQRPEGDTKSVPKSDRDPDRNIRAAVKNAVLSRDGFRCRYCGIPVVSADIRKFFAKLYPSAVPWDARDPSKQHAGLQTLWLQFDHVEPHSHGGRSDPENVVVSCALCNFGKHGFTLRQLSLSDPRLRDPIPTAWDGLERLRPALNAAPKAALAPAAAQKAAVSAKPGHALEPTAHAASLGELQAFFILGAWLGNGYLFTPLIDGKERWFAIAGDVTAEPVSRNGVQGFRLVCPRSHLRRRGIEFERLIDTE